MSHYPNYRLAVEVIILHNDRVLLTRRAPDAKLGPDMWSVPSGKVKYLEVPLEALYREAKEETGLDVELIRELDVRAFQIPSSVEEIYRVMYTYLVQPKGGDITSLALNDEHSEYTWVDLDDLKSSNYDTLHTKLRELLTTVLSEKSHV